LGSLRATLSLVEGWGVGRGRGTWDVGRGAWDVGPCALSPEP